MDIADQIQSAFEQAEDKDAFIEAMRAKLHELSSRKDMPVDYVQWVPVDQVVANDYNPNAVAQVEMQLLYTSIDHDGYTQPIVTVYDPERAVFVIVDGFHRYFVGKTMLDIQARTGGKLPVVVLNKDINDRMASTVRHNRARGKHSVSGMSSLVFHMLDNGWSDAEICNELGMEPEELLRLKHITGFSKLFEDVDYNREWKTRKQIRLERDWKAKNQ